MTELVTFEDQTVELLPDRTTMATFVFAGKIIGFGGNAYAATIGVVNLGTTTAAVGGNGVQIG